MVFWGVEVKPGKPHTHSPSEDELFDGSTLHLSQATLGLEGKSKERAVVKCKVGDGPELLLCSLIPGVSESCSLDLLFDQDVTFSVVGSASVHLIGYYMPLEDEEDDDDYDSEGMSEEDSDEDSDEEMDSEMEDDERVPSSVKIVEIDEETPSPAPLKLIKGKDDESKPESKSAQKKRKKMEALGNAPTAKPKTPAGDAKKVETPAKATVDSEDEDGFPKNAPNKKQAIKGADGTPAPAASVTTTPGAATPESAGKKKKNKKNKNKDAQTPGAAAPAAAAATTPEPAKTAEKPGKKEKAKENGAEKTPGAKTPAPATNGSTPAAAKSAKKGSPAVKKFPNGLEIQDVAIGKPDAKQAKPGKRVGMIYTGRLKSNGKVFDSNVGKKPFEFRLGVGEVIKGWDVGVNGMRIGDKRKLVIPPAMGYGAKGVGGTIPGNATLEFDVELVNVK
ncbi:FK506-binding nuclear protein [Marchantia polymorpha subsp. ruderalis]|uniref:FK506-binding protein n=2 Tax=Marchantia polymorpha TaxID=3197 RepID=A0AAF6BJJ2_MARPO|nr:hypothetical protein MARPO_0084s0048 [Marchantia polymorpha]BBN12176.1 hypothetical protein Mp_5g18010 [Marchantia polymorpha subsp. ruderalis]|eukprot:PTQ33962.1 hypothetical protein MARPO_0084s0048 [Marchantia polymorpha]